SSTSSALNDLYNTTNTKITNFKTTIAQAITDMGVTTEEESDAETMANNIRKLSSFNNIPDEAIIVELRNSYYQNYITFKNGSLSNIFPIAANPKYLETETFRISREKYADMSYGVTITALKDGKYKYYVDDQYVLNGGYVSNNFEYIEKDFRANDVILDINATDKNRIITIYIEFSN
ncbi:MAG: hypothetical protein ACI31M_04645, partial [Bacilli bacterium]